MALDRNPDLLALRRQEKAGELRAVAALAPQNPVLSYSRNSTQHPDPTSTTASSTQSVSLTLGFPGKAVLQSLSQRYASKGLEETARAKEVDIISNLSAVYGSLSVNEKLAHFLRDEHQKARNVIEVMEKRYSLAQASEADVLNSRLAAANLDHDLLVVEGDRRTLIAQFLNLIREPGNAELLPQIPDNVVIPPLALTAEKFSEILRQNSHVLRAASFDQKASRALYHGSLLSPLPDFQLAFGRNHYNTFLKPSDATGGDHDYISSVGISVPLFFPMNELQTIRAARLESEAARYRRDGLELSALLALQTSLAQFEASQKQRSNLEAYVLPAAGATYELVLKNYALGKSDYLRLNDARNSYIDAKRAYWSSTREAIQSYAQITQQLGCDPSGQEKRYACF